MVTLPNENLLFIYTIYHVFTSIDTKEERNLVLILLTPSLGWGRRKAHGRCKKKGYLIRPFPIHFAGDILRLSHAYRIGFLTELAPVESGKANRHPGNHDDIRDPPGAPERVPHDDHPDR
jgi:hypothetical protein